MSKISIDQFPNYHVQLKVVNNQVRTFLSQHSTILKSYQSGFRPGHSTVTAASKVLTKVASALDSKQDCVRFIDYLRLSNSFEMPGIYWI